MDPPTRDRRGAALACCILLLLASCSPSRNQPPPAAPPVPTTVPAPPVTVPAPPDEAEVAAEGPACAPEPVWERGEEPAPAELIAALEARLADPRLAGHQLSASIWIEGYGEVLAHEPDLALLPASNQKLLTAMGALALLPVHEAFVTAVALNGELRDGTLVGDLVLVAGGDPTLRGEHLSDLAAQVRAAGVRQVTGSLVVDESRFDDARAAPGWEDWQQPAYGGALSALIVDGNQYRGDGAFLADPATVGAQRFAAALRAHGVAFDGDVRHGSAGAATVVASHTSPSFDALIVAMLMRSDNMIAESLVKEIGVRHAGEGSTLAGLHVIRSMLVDRCAPMAGSDGDGSGLSRANQRSAREWRQLLQIAAFQPWGAALRSSLPVAGHSGTLAGRLGSAPTAGNVAAKTGSIIPGRSLSGYATTTGGRAVVFSIVVNGEGPGASVGAIDDLVASVVAHPG